MTEAAAQATRRFPRELYEREALDEALAAYADFATLSVDESDDAWVVALSGVDEDFEPEMLASELANFVLAGTIERKR